MREVRLYDPRAVVGNLFNPRVPKFRIPEQNQPGASAAAEEQASQDAARRSRAAAAARTGRRQTLLTGGTAARQADIPTGQRTLLGSAAA